MGRKLEEERLEDDTINQINVDLIELDRVVDSLGRGNVKWTYVKGHGDNYGNNQAYKLAVAGAIM